MTGDASLRRRPMRRVIDPLTAMGARITSQGGLAPLVIEGRPSAGVWNGRPQCPAPRSRAPSFWPAFVPLEPRQSLNRPRRGTTRNGHSRSLACRVTSKGCGFAWQGGQWPTAPRSRLRVPGDPSSAAVWAAAAAVVPWLAGSHSQRGLESPPHRVPSRHWNGLAPRSRSHRNRRKAANRSARSPWPSAIVATHRSMRGRGPRPDRRVAGARRVRGCRAAP